MVLAQYGPRWKLMRKLTSLHLLGPKALEHGAALRREEVGILVRAVRDAGTVAVQEILSSALGNIISRMMLSRRVMAAEAEGPESGFKDLVKDALTLSDGAAGNRAQTVNMEESFGLTLKMAVPLTAIARPRLSPCAYAI
ncbi:hypothetical protein SAY86_008710 [Trapa natans]|uniref:Uncharacterized protein n=1 Tax=Trapa natans TaxID=22666 RepID=A0AAN7KAP2_TRANT|nr:hypothetical protein SAY86_008710 [Trapa natans]